MFHFVEQKKNRSIFHSFYKLQPFGQLVLCCLQLQDKYKSYVDITTENSLLSLITVM